MESKSDLATFHDIFSKHSLMYDREYKERIERFKKDYPDSPLPETITDYFNLPFFFKLICEEILELKKRG